MERRSRNCLTHRIVSHYPNDILCNVKDDTEVREVATTPFRVIIGMLSYIAGHTKLDIAYALNVLAKKKTRSLLKSSCEVLQIFQK